MSEPEGHAFLNCNGFNVGVQHTEPDAVTITAVHTEQ